MRRIDYISWMVAGICLAAFLVITLLGIYIFERIPHSEDEVAYVFQAKVLAQNRLAVPTPLYPDAFWTPFVVDYQGQRFGKYPIGWPWLLSLGIRLKTPWLVNTLLGTLTLALVARLGYYFYKQERGIGPQIALVAAGLGLVTPGFLFLSSSLLSHAASLFWVTLSLAFLYPLVQTPFSRPGRTFLLAGGAGLALGATFTIRPFTGVAIAGAIGLFLLVLRLRREVGWLALVGLCLGGLPVAALLPAYWWAVTGDPGFNAYVLVWPYDRVGFGPDIGPYGYTLFDGIFINTRLKLITLGTGLFGWPSWSNLMFLPLPFLARRANRWDWLLLGLILALVASYTCYWSFGGVDGGFPRYYYEALPGFLLLTARGIFVAADYLKRQAGTGGRWLVAGLVGALVIYNLGWTLPLHLAAQKGKYEITPEAVERVEEARLPTPALVLVQDMDVWSEFAVPFVANSPTLDGPVVYAIDWEEGYTRQLRRHFAGRSCWELEGEILESCPEMEIQ